MISLPDKAFQRLTLFRIEDYRFPCRDAMRIKPPGGSPHSELQRDTVQLSANQLIAHDVRPAVGGKYCRVEPPVGEIEPIGTPVVQVRQSAILEVGDWGLAIGG